MDSFRLSSCEDEELPDYDSLLAIASSMDEDSDLDESNTPTEPYEDETDQEQPILISDDSDMEENGEEDGRGDSESVLGTISLRRVRGTVQLNRYVSFGFRSFELW